MKRPSLNVTDAGAKGFCVSVPPTLTKSGKRERRYWQDEKQAKKFARSMRKRYHELGTKAGAIDPALAQAAVAAREALEPLGATLAEAVAFYVERHGRKNARLTVGEAWDEYTAWITKQGRRDATLRDYTQHRKRLPAWFSALVVAGATPETIDRALDEETSTEKRGPTWIRRRREILAVTRWAMGERVEKTRRRNTDPEILTSEQAGKLMAEADKAGVALPFALLLFAGIRPDARHGELGRLTRSAIGKREIKLPADVSKTGDSRIIPILPNLRAWLDACPDAPLCPPKWETTYAKVRKAAGVTGQDLARHSFGSAFYRIHGGHETEQAMGHSTFRTFQSFYKRAMTLADAQAYFCITPEGVTVEPPEGIRAVG